MSQQTTIDAISGQGKLHEDISGVGMEPHRTHAGRAAEGVQGIGGFVKRHLCVTRKEMPHDRKVGLAIR